MSIRIYKSACELSINTVVILFAPSCRLSYDIGLMSSMDEASPRFVISLSDALLLVLHSITFLSVDAFSVGCGTKTLSSRQQYVYE